jgi:hypothetical protein
MRLFAHKGYLTGFLLSILLLGILSFTDFYHLRAPGQNNTGHETLGCIECHEKHEGTTRQQIQANIAYLTGQRDTVVTFNYEAPDTNDCLACHERDNDNHPIYRFNEPRFSEARKAIQPQLCNSCHTEHSGVRVTSDADNCQLCHEELIVKEDTIEIPHSTLVQNKQWDSCLGCHDYHGSHIMEVPKLMDNMLDKQLIDAYFNGGNDPYSAKKMGKVKETRYEN